MPDYLSIKGILPAQIINSHLQTSGGSTDATVDGSVTPVDFFYTVAGRYAVITRMLFYIEDSTAFSATEFGGLGSALTNGVDIIAGGVNIANWKRNFDLSYTMYDASSAGRIYGKETQVMNCRWTFSKVIGQVGGIHLDQGETFIMRVNDDLRGLDIFHIHIQGVEET